MRRAWRCGSPWLVVLGLLLLYGAVSASPPPAWRTDGSDIHVGGEGNDLVARRSASVRFSTMDQLLAAIEERPASPAAIRLVRGAPGQLIDYFFCITADGRLIVGQQVWRLDPVSGGYMFERGELMRAYSPLEGEGSWTWLIGMPVGRESEVTLVVRADGDGWPVRNVRLTRLGSP